MSGYPDDRDDDRDDDRPTRRRDDDDRGDRRDDEDDIRAAKSAVSVPAIGLIVVAALSLLSVVLGLVQYASLDTAFDEQVKTIENNPQLTDAQKKEQVRMMNQIRDVMKAAWIPYYGLVGLCALLTLIGGIKLMNLSSPGLVYLSAVLALLPCTSGCCLLGLVFGIWAMVVMGKPEVKAGFAAKRRLASSPDRY